MYSTIDISCNCKPVNVHQEKVQTKDSEVVSYGGHHIPCKTIANNNCGKKCDIKARGINLFGTNKEKLNIKKPKKTKDNDRLEVDR